MVLSKGKHPVPFRTRKLSLLEPMVLQGGLCGRLGRRRAFKHPLGDQLWLVCPGVFSRPHAIVRGCLWWLGVGMNGRAGPGGPAFVMSGHRSRGASGIHRGPSDPGVAPTHARPSIGSTTAGRQRRWCATDTALGRCRRRSKREPVTTVEKGAMRSRWRDDQRGCVGRDSVSAC